MRVLCLGDIVGHPGRDILKERLPAFRKEKRLDFVVANGENAAAGSGLTPKVLEEILAAGVDVITTGDHIYKNREVFGCIGHERLLRPLNYVEGAEGRGLGLYRLPDGTGVGVFNLQGRVFMEPSECPFRAADQALSELSGKAKFIIVDMHAEATSEKVAMGWHLDGRVGVVFGTHTHIQTADERVLPQGTAYITDVGMTGPYDSILGRDKERVLTRFRTQMPARFDVAEKDVRMCGFIADLSNETGKATSVERVALKR